MNVGVNERQICDVGCEYHEDSLAAFTGDVPVAKSIVPHAVPDRHPKRKGPGDCLGRLLAFLGRICQEEERGNTAKPLRVPPPIVCVAFLGAPEAKNLICNGNPEIRRKCASGLFLFIWGVQ